METFIYRLCPDQIIAFNIIMKTDMNTTEKKQYVNWKNKKRKLGVKFEKENFNIKAHLENIY